ncbi:hypothetical protein [Thioalkalivibrio sp. AKL10]|uniref:hypothetical protein n=1 Tax=Thioalkalivibrio sp. AKL10 TaxID=1158158 RepID=UPI00037948B2|nr:hypothetical protein [Thioalkalivibrio sp. AKL10]
MHNEQDVRNPNATNEPPVRDHTIGFVGYVLYIAAPFTGGLTAIAAVIIAYVQRENGDSILRTHWNNMIRIFWTSFVVLLAVLAIWMAWMSAFGAAFMGTSQHGAAGQAPDMGSLMAMAAAASLITLTWTVWVIVRSVIGIIDLNQGRAMGQPPGLFTGR